MTDHPSALVSVPEMNNLSAGERAFTAWAATSGADGTRLMWTWAEMPPSQRERWEKIALAAAPAAPQAAGVGEAGPAEREVGRAVYERIEKLMDTDPRSAELDYLSHLAESVEEIGGYDGPLTPLRAPSREPEGGAVDERLKWFLMVIEGAGGEVCSTESRHNPINVFCEDRDKGDDTFNISEAAGYTQTSHDTSFDTSTTRITDKGRTYLATLYTHPTPDALRELEAQVEAARDSAAASDDALLAAQSDAEDLRDALRAAVEALEEASSVCDDYTNTAIGDGDAEKSLFTVAVKIDNAREALAALQAGQKGGA